MTNGKLGYRTLVLKNTQVRLPIFKGLQEIIANFGIQKVNDLPNINLQLQKRSN